MRFLKALVAPTIMILLQICPALAQQPADKCCGYEVHGYVWHDVNGNGIDESEPRLAGWTVEAYNVTSSYLAATTVTDINGEFTFRTPVGCGPDGSFSLVLQSGWGLTFPAPPGTHLLAGLGGCGSIVQNVNFGVTGGPCAPFTETWTLDGEFGSGNPNGVATVSDNLQLTPDPVTLGYAWVANYDGTVSRIDTATGNEVSRHFTGPPDVSGQYGYLSPSRTAVDADGNCWVLNRNFGRVASLTQILATGGIDRNSSSTIETSLDNITVDGMIAPSEMLPWGDDGRVARHYLIGGALPDNTGRALAIDKSWFLWVGLYGGIRVIKVDPGLSTVTYAPDLTPAAPPELASVDTSPHHPYGLALSPNGMLHLGTLSKFALEIDPGLASGGTAAGPIVTQFIEHPAPGGPVNFPTNYGIAVDQDCIVWLTGSQFTAGPGTEYGCIRWDPSVGVGDPTLGWTFSTPGASDGGRGITVDYDGFIWMTLRGGDVAKYAPTNPPTWLANYATGLTSPVGVGAASDGHLVVTEQSSSTWVKLDKTTGALMTLAGPHLAGPYPYTYSDFTGSLQAIVNDQQGFWTAVSDAAGHRGRGLVPRGRLARGAAHDRLDSGLVVGPAHDAAAGAIHGGQGPAHARDRLRRAVGDAGAARCHRRRRLRPLRARSRHAGDRRLRRAAGRRRQLRAAVAAGRGLRLGEPGGLHAAAGLPVPDGHHRRELHHGQRLGRHADGLVPGDRQRQLRRHHRRLLHRRRVPVDDRGRVRREGWHLPGQRHRLRPGLRVRLRTPRAVHARLVPAGFGPRRPDRQHRRAHGARRAERHADPDARRMGDGLVPFRRRAEHRPDRRRGPSDAGRQHQRRDHRRLGAHHAGDGPGAFVADGQWHMVAVTIDRNHTQGLKFFVDGAQVGASLDPTSMPGNTNSSAECMMGRSHAVFAAATWYDGDLDEVDLFRRALTADEIAGIFGAGIAGKCREACSLPDRIIACGGTSVATSITICNYDDVPHLYSWGLSPVAAGCTSPASGFSPAFGSVTVAGGDCVSVPVTVLIPSSLPNGGTSCFEVSIMNHDTGRMFGCSGSIKKNKWWCIKWKNIHGVELPGVVQVNPAHGASLKLAVAHPVPVTPGLVMDYELRPVMEEADGYVSQNVGLNGSAPGRTIKGSVPIPEDGAEVEIPVSVSLFEHMALGFDLVQVWADDDMDGLMEPIGDGVPMLRAFRTVPNPFNPQTSISFELAGTVSQAVDLNIFDLRGRNVKTIYSQQVLAPGVHTVNWTGDDKYGRRLASGVYLVRIVTPTGTETVKAVLVKWALPGE